MNVTVNKLDEANIVISGTIESSAVQSAIEVLAKQAGKEIKVDGFRKGKVPAHVVKKLHGEKLAQDAEGEVLKNIIDAGIKESGIKESDILGQPTFKKYDKQADKIEVEVEVSLRPTFDTTGHLDVVPAFERPTASQEEIDAKLLELATENAPFEALATPRAVEDGDMIVIDFEGFVDGVAFEGGKAEKFRLKIGSGQFIPGFEEQLIGLNYAEEKTIEITFPTDYQAPNLAGKISEFKIKLHEIHAQATPKVDEALAEAVLKGQADTSLATLTEKVKMQIESSKISKIYNETLKPQLVEALVAKFNFALPNNIVEQEIDAKINAKAQEMSEEELATYKNNNEKIEALREELRGDAEASVKATFIVDALAKAEGVSVDDQEVSQAIYYESMMTGQNPQEVIKYYQNNNLLPAVKMGMIEDKLFGKMLGLDK